MKRKLLLTSVIFLVTFISKGQEFITTWTTLNGNDNISFDAETTGSVSYTWETIAPAPAASGSGTFTGSNVTISSIPQNTSITLTIQPTNLKRFISSPGFFFYRLDSVEQWGDVEWESMENAFKDNPQLQVTATDFPDLSNAISLASMFENCQLLNSPFNINFWDISNVTNLSGMFKGCVNFNQALSQWNTANVTNMSSLFEGATEFNQNIGNWNTANVTNMNKMFKEAQFFDSNIGNWNTANVTDMSEMFSNNNNFGFPTEFNKDISGWNTSNVTNMSGMFYGAEFFDRNIGNWDTSNVTDMSEMFKDAISFNQNLGNWNTSNVTNMSGMFSNQIFNNQPENYLFNNGGSPSIQNWDTSNVVDMSGMFSRATNLNHNLGNWSLLESEDLTNMLDRSGLDCDNYSTTLIGWNSNPDTPDNLILGATFLEYKSEAIPAVQNLVTNKSWGFSGHDLVSTIPDFNIQNTYCDGEATPPLPAVSSEGIAGTWTPALDNTQTTTYTFTPNDGECALDANITIFINDNTIPTFTQVSPICAGESLSALPTTSNNGIVGTWSPALDNTTTTTYTFTPDDGQCATTNTLTITVNSTATSPTFTQIPDICEGETLSPLPTTSNNGINGTWSPQLDNTQTTTYTFTPDDGQCATNTTLTINVTPIATPVFSEIPAICEGETLSPLPTTSINGITGTWSPQLDNTQTTTYTFSPDDGQCATNITLTINVNPLATPNFTDIDPICEGETLSPLPTTSNNGITGTWSPALDNTQTTTYTFSPDDGQCATNTTLTINVNQLATPTFTDIDPICEGQTLSPLPTTSNNGINGTWSPALDNTQTTTYTFSPDDGQCASNTTLTIVVNTIENPTVDTTQTLMPGDTISDIVINPTTVIWYATLADALADLNPLASNFPLEDDTTYFAVNDNGECRSEPIEVLLSFPLSVENNDFNNLDYYPNPVSSIICITNDTPIDQVEVYNLLGQQLIKKHFNETKISLDLNKLSKSIYLIKIKTENHSHTFKIIKE